jgi:serine/threonine protein kinase
LFLFFVLILFCRFDLGQPEALTDRTVSVASDMWMACICGLELFAVGEEPFAGMKNERVVEVVTSGQAASYLAQPDTCPDELFDVVTSAVAADPSDRPTATELLRKLNRVRGQIFSSPAATAASGSAAPVPLAVSDGDYQEPDDPASGSVAPVPLAVSDDYQEPDDPAPASTPQAETGWVAAAVDTSDYQ